MKNCKNEKEYNKHEIESVKDLMPILDSLEKTDSEYSSKGRPFGIWFRGQSNTRYYCEPTVFRKQDRKKDEGVFYNEDNIFMHSKLRLASYREMCQNDFDWLCLMQHYDIPTRVLDWSEGIIIALYFCVRNLQETDGELIALDARRLNSYIRNNDHGYFSGCDSYEGVLTPDHISVDILSTMARCKGRNKLFFELGRKNIKEEELKIIFDNFSMPVAVFPNRFNQRMFFQSSVFTLHGGKKYSNESLEQELVALPKPISLEEIDEKMSEKEKILKYYTIPAGCKEEIKKELFRLGIHEGSLFPEIDCQAKYFKEQWLPSKKQ